MTFVTVQWVWHTQSLYLTFYPLRSKLH